MKTELKSLWHSSHTIAFICVYLRTEFQGSSIILMSFRKGVILPPPLHRKTQPSKAHPD